MNNEQENVSVGDSMSNALLSVNKMLYKMPPALGICQRRNHRTDYFQRSTYTNGTMVLDCQLGSDFCDPRNSYIRFKLTAKGSTGANISADLASGSAVNVINRILVNTRTGKELCRVENANLITKFNQLYNCEEDWLRTVARIQGYADNTQNLTPTGGQVYVLPLSIIPCFDTDKLLPPQLMEGIRIELFLEDTATVFREAKIGGVSQGVPTSYQIDNPEIHWDSFDIADAYKRKIAQMASSSGLSLVHKEWFHTIVAAGSSGQTDFNFDIKKAASKALKVCIVSRANAQIANTVYDSMGSLAYDYSRQQAHIGADYFPQQPINVNAPFDSTENAESYYNVMFAHNKTNQCWNPPSVSVGQYQSLNAPIDTQTGAPPSRENSLVAFNLNKSHVSDLQGYVVNTSRAILVDLKAGERLGNFPDGNADVQRRLDIYLCHLRAVKVYTSNCEIRD